MGQDTSWLSNHVCHGNSRQNSAFQKEKDPGADHRAKSSADLGYQAAFSKLLVQNKLSCDLVNF
jgi:hypothetical protein